MSEPLYAGLVEELGDPEPLCREIDEFAIQWHADRMRGQSPPEEPPSPRGDG